MHAFLTAAVKEEFDIRALPHRMAGAIVVQTERHGSCEPRDLFAAGYTQSEIDRFWPMAFALAQVRLNRSDA